MDFAWTLPQCQALRQWSKDEVFDAIAQYRKALESGPEDQPTYPDLRTPEWEVFSAPVSPEGTDDFTLLRDPQGVPATPRKSRSATSQTTLDYTPECP